MRACAFFSPSLDPVLDRGKGHKHPVVTPQVPAGRTGGHAIFDHEPHREVHHAMRVVTSRWCQIGQVRIEVLAALGAVMLRIGDHEITRTPQVEIAHVVEGSMGLLVLHGYTHTTRTHVPLVITAVGNHLWLGQVGSGSNAFAGIGSIRTRTAHGFIPLVRMSAHKLYTKSNLDTTP